MKKRSLLLFILLSFFLLTGCSANKDKAPASTPASAQDGEPSSTQTGIAQGVQELLSPYQSYLDKIAPQCKSNLSYSIPADMLHVLVQNADAAQVLPENGFYSFTINQTENHTYRYTGLEYQEQQQLEFSHNPDMTESPMEDQNTGDFIAAGGGEYHRTYRFDIAADFSQGTLEITNFLNDATTGHEKFTFLAHEGALFFAYGALELTADLDTLESTGAYLVTIGKMEPTALQTVDYLVPSSDQVPLAQTMDFDALLASVSPLSSISARDAKVKVKE